ncbi:hypothetical protein D3C85_776520 [compost metagenome]
MSEHTKALIVVLSFMMAILLATFGSLCYSDYQTKQCIIASQKIGTLPVHHIKELCE